VICLCINQDGCYENSNDLNIKQPRLGRMWNSWDTCKTGALPVSYTSTSRLLNEMWPPGPHTLGKSEIELQEAKKKKKKELALKNSHQKRLVNLKKPKYNSIASFFW
jgi:hypothetical protein